VSTTPNTTPTTIAASDVIALFIREARHRALQQTREKGGAAMYVSSGASQKNSSVTIAESPAMSKLTVGLKVVIRLDRVLTRNLRRRDLHLRLRGTCFLD